MHPRKGRSARALVPSVRDEHLRSGCACEEPRGQRILVLLDERFVRLGYLLVSFGVRSGFGYEVLNCEYGKWDDRTYTASVKKYVGFDYK